MAPGEDERKDVIRLVVELEVGPRIQNGSFQQRFADDVGFPDQRCLSILTLFKAKERSAEAGSRAIHETCLKFPSRPIPRPCFAGIYAAKGHTSEAAQVLDGIESIYGDDPFTLMTRARTALFAKDYATTHVALERLRSRGFPPRTTSERARHSHASAGPPVIPRGV